MALITCICSIHLWSTFTSVKLSAVNSGLSVKEELGNSSQLYWPILWSLGAPLKSTQSLNTALLKQMFIIFIIHLFHHNTDYSYFLNHSDLTVECSCLHKINMLQAPNLTFCFFEWCASFYKEIWPPKAISAANLEMALQDQAFKSISCRSQTEERFLNDSTLHSCGNSIKIKMSSYVKSPPNLAIENIWRWITPSLSACHTLESMTTCPMHA